MSEASGAEGQGLVAGRGPGTCPESRNETGPSGQAPPRPLGSGTLPPGISKGVLGNWAQGQGTASRGGGFPNSPIQALEVGGVRASLPGEEAPSREPGRALPLPSTHLQGWGREAGGLRKPTLPPRGPARACGRDTGRRGGAWAGKPPVCPRARPVLPKLHLPLPPTGELGVGGLGTAGQWAGPRSGPPALGAPPRQPAPHGQWCRPRDPTCPLGPESPAAGFGGPG